MSFRSILAAALVCAALPAFATPQPIDASGLWFNQEESGWGMSVYHQGDTLFASLFVYGPDGQPRWYTASGLTGSYNTYSGPLTESTGPYFGAATFDPRSVTRRTVGKMTMFLNTVGHGSVEYTIDGVSVGKPITQFTIRTVNTSGNYIGAEVAPFAADPLLLDQHFGLVDNGSQLNVFTDSNRTASCAYMGSGRSQTGNLVWANGNSTCKGGQPTDTWAAFFSATPHGFTANATWNWPTGHVDGARVAAAKRTAPSLQGTGYINDLWFPPEEAGWGLNLVDQGDTAFATLFVYDAQNRPHWYSASNLIAGITNGRPAWSGNLEESTGPYFGGNFNPSQVTRRVVGTMSFILQENGDGALGFTVNGVTAVKTVKRYAFRKQDLSGSYQGSVVMRTDDPRGGSYDDASITIDDQGDHVVMFIDILTGPSCGYSLQSIQYGSLRSFFGNYSCGNGLLGRIEMNDLKVTAEGFTGSYQGPAGHIGGFITNGNISGARR